MNIGKLTPAAINAVILLVFTGLFISLYILKNNILPFNGERVYKMHRSTDNFYIFIDSLSLDNTPPVTSTETAPAQVRINAGSLTLNHNPSLAVWMMAVSVMFGTALGLIIPLLFQVLKLQKIFRASWRTWIFQIIFGLLIGAFLAAASHESSPVKIGHDAPDLLLSAFNIITEFKVLLRDVSGLMVMINITMLVGLIAVVGMLFINYCIPHISNVEGDPNGRVALFQLLNDSLRFFLMAISVLILFSIVTTTLVQQSIDRVMTIRDFTLFPTEFIYAYGLIFTTFLASIYIPIQYHLKSEGKRMADAFRQSGVTIAEENIKQLEMKEPAAKNIQVFFTILAPILGSVFTDLLKHITQ